ncbi:MAG: hypothetical protein M3R70_06045 [Actinomycetota bacterium]|nr:hypothetical protein [Actinomycetota bacterium]
MGFDLYWADYAAAPDDAPRPIGAYFRLTNSGMSVVAHEMETQGMLYRAPFPRFPPWDEYVIPVDEDGEPDESSAAYRSYSAALALVTAGEDQERSGIPTYKVSTNDDWLITPGEIEGALTVASLEPKTLDGNDDGTLWLDWLAFLRAAKEHGGVRVW